MKEHVTIIRMGGEVCPVWDWKTYAVGQIKDQGTGILLKSCKVLKGKRIIITKTKNKNVCLVQGEPFYNFEGREPKSVNKKGNSFKNHNVPTLITESIALKLKKAEDVKTLLKKHYGNQ